MKYELRAEKEYRTVNYVLCAIAGCGAIALVWTLVQTANGEQQAYVCDHHRRMLEHPA